jgi:hypothetical protein
LTGTATSKATIVAAPLVVTVSNATRAYGVANPMFSGTIAGALNGDTFAISYSTAATITSSVGSYAINASVSGANLANYSLTVVPGTLTITTATTPLVVTVNNATRAYGATNPTFTSTITGALNGDTFTISYSTVATTASPIGSYTINATVSGAAAANYTVSTANGTLTIYQAPAATITINNASRAYGAANPTFSYTNTSGVLNGDTFVLSYSTTATTASPVGSYAINATVGGAAAANYANLTVNPGTLTITQAPLTVTVNNATRAYGGANPTFSGTIAGALNGDTFTVTYSTTATVSSSVGSYTITTSVSGANLANYSLTVVPGALTITAVPLAVTVNNATQAYGEANPTFSSTITGAVNGDTFAVAYSTTVMATSLVGTYAISATVSGTNLADYSLTVNPGTLTITQTTMPLVVTVNNASRAYGGANPAFSSTVTGALNGDTFTVNYTTVATALSSVGSYAINATVGGVSAANYANITVNPGTLTITQAPLTVTVNNATRAYGAADPAFSSTTTGAVNGDTFTIACSTTATIDSSAGSYAINAAVSGTNLANYILTVSPGTLTIITLSNVALTGVASSGATPIVGAHVYLFAANTIGYGAASSSLLLAAETGTSDSVGAYATTGSNGGFSLTGDYGCASGQQLYLYVLGGNAGSGTNSASGLMAVVGSCPANGSIAIYANVNEVTTIAAAYAIAGFATDATHVSSSGTALAQTGVANAFASAANLASLSSGTALATTPAGNGTVPQTEINTLANILASCVNTGSCTTLLTTATSDGTTNGTKPTDTATVAINIAHHPGANVGNLFALAGSTFTPKLAVVPTDYLLALIFTGGLNGPLDVEIDGSGNVWVTNVNSSCISVFSNLGVDLSGIGGYCGGSLSTPETIAIDSSGNAWITNSDLNNSGSLGANVTVLSRSGSFLSGATGYTGGGISTPDGIAIDGSGNAWIANTSGVNSAMNAVTKLSSSGVPLSGAGGYTGGGLSDPLKIAIDGFGNVWTINYYGNSVTEFSSTGSILCGGNGYTGGGISGPGAIAIDSFGDVWVGNYYNNSVTKLSSMGTVLSGANGYMGGGLGFPKTISIDGAGNAWIANMGGNRVTEISSSGTFVSGASGYIGDGQYGHYGIAIDGSGNVWSSAVAGYVSELVGAGTPAVTPLAVGVKNNTLGTRP